MKLFAFTLLVSLALAQAGPFDRISESLDNFRHRMEGSIEEAMKGISDRMSELTKDFGNIGRSLQEVSNCYRAQMTDEEGAEEFNIFNGDLSTMEVVQKYYSTFSNKNVSSQSVRELMNSVRDMISHCLNSTARTGNSTVQKGFTSLSDVSDQEFESMMGHIPMAEDEDVEQEFDISGEGSLNRQRRASGSDSQCQLNEREELPKSHDWRKMDVVTSVKNQGSCGSCWTFASLGALESAQLIKSGGEASKGDGKDLSEQTLVNCAKSYAGYSGGGCQGGNSQMAFKYIKEQYTTTESERPYKASDETCRKNSIRNQISISDFCVRSKFRYTYSSRPEDLSDDTMARALVQKGPLYIAVNATPLQYRNVRSGVINEPGCSKRTNHAVLLVGYDGSDNSWIIKNSWGPNWGDKGYFKLARGSNMCGVNTEIAWPIV